LSCPEFLDCLPEITPVSQSPTGIWRSFPFWGASQNLALTLLISGNRSESPGLSAEPEPANTQGWERRAGSCGELCLCCEANPGRARPSLPLADSAVTPLSRALIGQSGEKPVAGATPRALVRQQRHHFGVVWARPGTGAAELGGGPSAVPANLSISLVSSSSQPGSSHLLCSMMDFYPAQIQLRWFQGQQELSGHVVDIDVVANGNWTYQLLVQLQIAPLRWVTYLCQVEHVSQEHPLRQLWEMPPDTAHSKTLTGIGDFMLGLVFLALGLGFYVHKKSS
ncbi:DLA class II histocompatibility antigen, DR-1 beta chain-like, partial [Catharus ustulatus]|uniref:DLA class II histocompatibility antigen, DR-1 beta chain-like n=1 Tax=Catharus ustulatus TaxID=91951 RepID=UPI001C5BBBA1